MKRVLLGLVLLASACAGKSSPSSPTSTTPVLGFFVIDVGQVGHADGLGPGQIARRRDASSVNRP